MPLPSCALVLDFALRWVLSVLCSYSVDLPLAFLLVSCCSLGFYSASRWCGPLRLSLSQLLPVWTMSKVSQAWSSLAAGQSRKDQWTGLFPVCPSLAHTHRKFQQLSNILHHLYFFLFFFTLNVLPPLPGELNTLPFSHMLLMFRMLSVTTGRSTAPERGDRDSLFSLWGDRNLGFKLR